MKKIVTFLLLLSHLGLTSCLFDNDMSYPDVYAEILNVEIEGQVSVDIDKESRSVSVKLNEVADITNLKLKSIQVSDDAKIVEALPDYLDLSDTLRLTLRTYQDYEWTITATQTIKRYIKVENQVGNAELDVDTRAAIVYVSENQLLSKVSFLDVKLEPTGSVVTTTTAPDDDGTLITTECNFPMVLDCVHRRTFLVKHEGKFYEWTLKVLKRKIEQQITKVDTWCYKARIYGVFSGKGTPGLEYRKASQSEWMVVSDASVNGVGITADINGLEASTEYIVRLSENGVYSSEFTFVTGKAEQLYNMNFDDWNMQGKVWYPYASGSEPSIWDSANPGAATFIGSSTTPEDGFVVKGKAARLESKYAVIAFAAGNIYTGKFGKIAGIGAELDWGVPFEGRPAALKGYYSYSPKTINYAKAPHEDKKGQTDRCQITVFITDWDEPFRISTTAGRFVDFENDPGIIAFGRLETGEDTQGEYREFTLPLEYRDKTRKPKYVVIACAASYLGDYFTGGVGSTMYVDEFEFIYE